MINLLISITINIFLLSSIPINQTLTTSYRLRKALKYHILIINCQEKHVNNAKILNPSKNTSLFFWIQLGDLILHDLRSRDMIYLNRRLQNIWRYKTILASITIILPIILILPIQNLLLTLNKVVLLNLLKKLNLLLVIYKRFYIKILQL